MSFLQPLFLAALAAAALPIIIHLINRRKAVHRPFPALKLLKESNEKIARSVKVRQWLLLALRVLAIAVLVFALAKPFVLSSEGMTADERLPTGVVFVVENDVVMDYGDWLDRAKQTAQDEIGDLRPWDEAAVLTTADDEPPLADLTSEHREAADAADGVELRYHTGDLGRTLLDADDILAGSELPNRRIVVIGSGTDSPIESRRDLSLATPVDYIDITDGDEVENLAVTDVDYEQRGSSRDGNWNIDAVITNFGNTDRDGVRVELVVDDERVGAATVNVPAGESTTYRFEHHIDGPAVSEASVELVDAGGLDADNRWHFAIQPRQRARTLLVNGSPSSVPHDDELFFLTRALEPLEASAAGFSLSETTVDGLEARNLDQFDVVVLANVTRLSSDVAEDLVRFVESGGGLFISMGDQVDIDAYNQQLEQVLPRPLRGEKLLADRDDPDAPVKTTRLGHPLRQHPVFRAFEAPGAGILQSVSVYSYMLLDPAPSDRDAEVLLSYQNNAPALLERNVGQGRVLLFTSSLDRNWTDFPVRPAYLPMMNQSLMHLARRGGADTDGEYTVGERIDLDVGEMVQDRAIIHDPEANRHVEEPIDGLISFTPQIPGVHRVFADDDDESYRLDSLTITANADRDGSGFDSFPTTMLEEWSGDHDQDVLGEGDGPAGERRINLWSYFLFIVTLVLLAETVLGARRSVLVRTWQKITGWYG